MGWGIGVAELEVVVILAIFHYFNLLDVWEINGGLD